MFIENGRQPTNIDILDWAEEVQKLGAGEIFVVSVDNDGVCKGPDYELIEKLEQVCKVPLIYGGGVGVKKDVSKIFNYSGVDGVTLSHLLHFNKEKHKRLKNLFKQSKYKYKSLDEEK